jgi:S1-C subfamily serine protease
MRNVGWLNLRPVPGLLKSLLAALFAASLLSTAAPTETGSLEELISAVVKIKTHINPEGRTVQGLGRDREGTGILVDADGLILTIGYLMVEAYAAEVITNDGRTIPASIVGYDHETGFGLLRTIEPLKIKPFTFGKIADVKEKDVVVVASGGGAGMVVPALVVSKREFVGNWEYLLEEAIYTSPPHPSWSGAALINREGKLIGVGSLIVGDAAGTKENNPGNVFVPIDRLAPILGDLLTEGRPSGPGRPWLGMNADDTHGRLMVGRVTPGGPADKAGIKRGDVIMSVNGEATTTLPDFYRKVWSKGDAGAVIGLDIRNSNTIQHFDIQSINRLDHLKLKSTF